MLASCMPAPGFLSTGLLPPAAWLSLVISRQRGAWRGWWEARAEAELRKEQNNKNYNVVVDALWSICVPDSWLYIQSDAQKQQGNKFSENLKCFTSSFEYNHATNTGNKNGIKFHGTFNEGDFDSCSYRLTCIWPSCIEDTWRDSPYWGWQDRGCSRTSPRYQNSQSRSYWVSVQCWLCLAAGKESHWERKGE